MPFQSVPETAEIILRALSDAQTIVTTFYGRMTGGYDLTDIAQLANDVDAWVGSDWLSLVGPQYEYLETHVQGLENALDYEAGSSANTGPGTASGNPLPNNVAYSIKRQSVFTGRAARGRIFMPCMTDAMLSGANTVDPATVTNFITALYGLNTVLESGGWTPVIVHRTSGSVALVPAQTFEVVSWNAIDYTLDSQRRRLPGRGI